MDKILANLATKIELKRKQEKIKKLQAFDSSYFAGKSRFEDDGNYLVFQEVHKYFKKFTTNNKIIAWKSKG